MDQLSAKNIQIVLSLKEGVGFGFLKAPIIISCNLNGTILETDPVSIKNSVHFDSELVWKADKRAFRSLRLRNVPLKIEVVSSSLGAKTGKERVGYLLLSLLAAKPSTSSKKNTISHMWHRLLGVKPEGRSSNPQILLKLTVEDTPKDGSQENISKSVITPERTIIASQRTENSPIQSEQSSLRMNPLVFEMKGKQNIPTSSDLKPRLNKDGLIQLGDDKTCQDIFSLCFDVKSSDNIDLLLLLDGNSSAGSKEDITFSFSVFSETVHSTAHNSSATLLFRSSLSALSLYFQECPYIIAKACCGNRQIGICSVDFRKMLPTNNLSDFLTNFCKSSRSFSCSERCFMFSYMSEEIPYDSSGRKPFVDLEMTIKSMDPIEDMHVLKQYKDNDILDVSPIFCYHLDLPSPISDSPNNISYNDANVKSQNEEKCNMTLSKETVPTSEDVSAKLLKVAITNEKYEEALPSSDKIGDKDVPAPTSLPSLEGPKLHEEILKVIKDMNLIASSSNQQQTTLLKDLKKYDELNLTKSDSCLDQRERCHDHCSDSRFKKRETSSHPGSSRLQEHEDHKVLLSPGTKEKLTIKMVNELEDWKECQQELFKSQLKMKESAYLNVTLAELQKCVKLKEAELNKNIEPSRSILNLLNSTLEDLTRRVESVSERENKLRIAKEELEIHYSCKYRDLDAASKRMEDDFNHQSKLQQLNYQELEMKLKYYEKANTTLKETIQAQDAEIQTLKKSTLSNERLTNFTIKMRSLEESLESALQSKDFFKQQWREAVKEIQCLKLQYQEQLKTHSEFDKKNIYEIGLEQVLQKEQSLLRQDNFALQKLKEDLMMNT